MTLSSHGACRRADAVAVMGAHRVRTAHETGELLAPWPGVLVEARRATDAVTLACAAVLLTGNSGVLSGPTAAHLHGCTAASPTPVHVAVPYEHPLRSRPGLIVHNGSGLVEDRVDVAGLPCLALHRVVADLLCGNRPAQALAVTDQALALTEPIDREILRRAIGRQLDDRPDPRGTVRARRLLSLATGRAESPPESWLLFRIVDAGYPIPEVNFSLVDLDGKELYRLDLAWPDLRIAIEYHGYAAHVGRTEEDEARATDVRRRGWIHIDVWSDEAADPGRYQAELDAAFATRGVDMGHRRTGVLQARRHRDRGTGRRR